MSPNLADDLIIHIGLLGALMLILCVGCVIADYIFPHIPPLQRWLDSLPDYDEEEETGWQEAEHRERSARRRRHWHF